MRVPTLFSTLFALFLTACAGTDYDPAFATLPDTVTPDDFYCCHDPERYPDWVPTFIRDTVDSASNKAASLPPAPGSLSDHPEAQALLTQDLRPFDVVLVSNKARLSGKLLPGHFTHSAIYLGSEAQLRARGLWSHSRVRPLQADIRAGKVFAEAVPAAVRVVDAATLFDTDGALILRPKPGKADPDRVFETYAVFAGNHYDPTFDVCSNDRVACTELVYKALPGLNVPVRHVYDIHMVLPDDIAAAAIRGENMTVVRYVTKRPPPTHWAEGTMRDLMADIYAYWGPSPADAANLVPPEARGSCCSTGG